MPTVMQWVNRLMTKIEAQQRYAEPFEARYNNEYVLPFIANEYREVYGERVDAVLFPSLQAPRSGTAAIGIDALVERLTVLGGDAGDDKEANRVLEEAWEDNDLDVMHREAHRESLIKRTAIGAVHRSTTDRSKAVVSIEPPEQAAVHRSQAPPYDVAGYLKIWTDDWTGKRAGQLQLPGRDIPLVEGDDVVSDPEGSDVMSRWRADPDGEKRTGLNYVPAFEFAHRARLLKDPVSEIDRISTLVDIVDLIEGLMVFAGHFGAVPIRYASGLDIPRDPANPQLPLLGPDGKPMIGFKPRADHFWTSSNKDTKFGQLEPAGLASFVEWANHASSRVRAATSIASTYYSLDLKSHMSAELLKTDEAPMVRRINAMGPHGSYGQTWRRLQRCILDIELPTSRARVKSRWGDPETRIEAQATDSFQKVVASGMGVREAARHYLPGWTPEEVDRAVDEAEAARAAEADPMMNLLLTKGLPGTGADVDAAA